MKMQTIRHFHVRERIDDGFMTIFFVDLDSWDRKSINYLECHLMAMVSFTVVQTSFRAWNNGLPESIISRGLFEGRNTLNWRKICLASACRNWY